MKLFRVIVDDGERVFKTFTTGKNKKDMMDVYGGNGKFEKIEDVTKEYSVDIRLLEDNLKDSGYSKGEIALITALVEQHNKTISE